MGTKIEWADDVWNPVTGCDRVSPGCDHCYAETIARRFAGSKAFPEGFKVTLHPDRLDAPLRWRKPRRVFVNSMSDLFHPDVPDEFVVDVFAVMSASRWSFSPEQHAFLVLTKRPQRMAALLASDEFWDAVEAGEQARCGFRIERYGRAYLLPGVWLGVSVESQRYADLRLPYLARTPAAVRFVSAEPLLGPVDLTRWIDRWAIMAAGGSWTSELVDWVICGGESGPGARPMHPQWARDLRDQCERAGTAYFLKQWGAWAPGPAPEGWGMRDAVAGRVRAIDLDGQSRPLHEALPAPGTEFVYRVGKGAAGRLLDGREWSEYPA